MGKVLVCGVYLADRDNCAAAEFRELAESRDHQVEQRWVALDLTGGATCELPRPAAIVRRPTPKFELINGLLSDLDRFDFLLVVDDDVTLPRGFVDAFLSYVTKSRFALCQPARTADSYIDHLITTRMPGIDARLTRFVEIGPVFCIHRAAFDILLPFDMRSPMGWGFDLVWPALIERNGLRMGIVDATPVGHTMRKTLTNYSRTTVQDQMDDLLRINPHLPRTQAFTVLEVYA